MQGLGAAKDASPPQAENFEHLRCQNAPPKVHFLKQIFSFAKVECPKISRGAFGAPSLPVLHLFAPLLKATSNKNPP